MCTVDGCSKPPRRLSAMYCEMHYMRFYRNKTLEKINTAKQKFHSHGYVLIPASGHPLATNSYVYEHRAVYYDHYGKGPFNCYWCGSQVTWADLHIDHLDDDKKNNAIENLVASCPICNQKRGRHKIQETWKKKTGLEAFGKTLTLNQWSELIGISRNSIIERLKKGMTIEEALSKPRGKTGPKSNRSSTDKRSLLFTPR